VDRTAKNFFKKFDLSYIRKFFLILGVDPDLEFDLDQDSSQSLDPDADPKHRATLFVLLTDSNN
jgi:hypothetical protein